jgi:hypothetical protein
VRLGGVDPLPQLGGVLAERVTGHKASPWRVASFNGQQPNS